MQLDMHYYGTYALAKAVGLKPAVCKTIAVASQFLMDSSLVFPGSNNLIVLDIVVTPHSIFPYPLNNCYQCNYSLLGYHLWNFR